MEKLVELYRSKFPSSPLTEVELKNELAWLAKTMSTESIFFSINYTSRYYPSNAMESIAETVNSHKWEILKYYEIAKAKQERKALKESEEAYDQKNTDKGAYTPSWFGKSFDKHLFE
ncbi:hypothetical protein HV436_01315 [Bacillus sporothermodurans]|uniref:hypothetical protein n=1 Tax=Heyndrickxia sporothermodurans TaxID=46224 RepID=UPI00192B7004|nr:hypothetical protein [Heyndrickxia sporothermodurans]MBL5776975.1 hypothetical protein [Heyndrickxia sporothermodurans]MBL5798502.1 hypothetical protein [Heyndrickxia sporothermodurans]MBL5809419.1 hypothetical protein [Heyndrickxia sporothermodurans]MBL5813054.1 hypothetical protein [Heyndrickxia sporothermodurans]MBL5816478.1 hypothetical protein [Heyndrickxia sporothermodurans]